METSPPGDPIPDAISALSRALVGYVLPVCLGSLASFLTLIHSDARVTTRAIISYTLAGALACICVWGCAEWVLGAGADHPFLKALYIGAGFKAVDVLALFSAWGLGLLRRGLKSSNPDDAP